MKLLNRTIRSYLFYSLTALIITIPLFYIAIRSVLLRSVDRSLRTQMRDIRSNLSNINSAGDLEVWSKMDKDIRIQPAESAFPDRYYTIYKAGHRRGDQDPYRELSGIISVNGRNYELTISDSLVENEDLLGTVLLVQSILLVLLMGGMLWINQRISKKWWQPFYGTLDSMKKYELHNHHAIQAIPTEIDEFRELQETIVSLTEKNLHIYQKQKEFTENASHEMQTPLAVLQGKIDLLLQTQPITEDQATLIEALEQVNQRLIKLNKSLLLLSKIDNNQFPQNESIQLEPLLRPLVDQVVSRAESANLSIRQEYNSSLTVRANRTLIEILVGNLLSNAVRYNRQNGEINVSLRGDTLQIQNTGTPQALRSERIFERFYKSGNHGSSIGLGLAIVKQICDLYRYNVSYQYTNTHHQFTVRFAGG